MMLLAASVLLDAVRISDIGKFSGNTVNITVNIFSTPPTPCIAKNWWNNPRRRNQDIEKISEIEYIAYRTLLGANEQLLAPNTMQRFYYQSFNQFDKPVNYSRVKSLLSELGMICCEGVKKFHSNRKEEVECSSQTKLVTTRVCYALQGLGSTASAGLIPANFRVEKTTMLQFCWTHQLQTSKHEPKLWNCSQD